MEAMERIGILTFHFAVNSGAVLQCLALKEYIEKIAPDSAVEIIDYQPDYHTNMYRNIINPFPPAAALTKTFSDRGFTYKAYRYLRNIMALLSKSRNPILRSAKRKAFEEYTRKHYRVSSRCRDEEDLRRCCGDYSIYITGSDQIWNSKITNYTIDYQYYLGFVSEQRECARISYAASASFSEDEIGLVAPFLKKYDAISVREEKARVQLAAAGFEKVRVDVDPTLLLQREDYLKFEEPCRLPYKDYILFYGLPTDNFRDLQSTLTAIRKELGLPVIDISPETNSNAGDYKDKIITPGTFLWYIKNAKYVVTNSFHGTVFSIIYHVPFSVVLPRLHNERLTQLVNSLELSKRIFNGEIATIKDAIPWQIVDEKMNTIALQSKDFLQSYIRK